MEFSSDDSFAWTDASTDSIDSDAMSGGIEIKKQSDNESEYGKPYKKKLQIELFTHDDVDINCGNKYQQKEKKRKIQNASIDSPKKKIKVEPESDIELSTNKNKSECNGLDIKQSTTESILSDESYLNLRIKQETPFVTPSSSVAKKKKKRKQSNSTENLADNELSDDVSTCIQTSNNDIVISCNDNSDTSQNMDCDENQTSKAKKKKKKKTKTKRRKDSTEEEKETQPEYIDVKDKFEAEETVVGFEHINNNKHFDNIQYEEQIENHHDSNYHHNMSDDDDNRNKSQHNDMIAADNLLDSEVVSDEEQSYCDSNDKNNILPKQTPSRTTRISDRIIFEGEDHSSIDKTINKTNKNHPTRSRKLEKFLKTNDNLKYVSSKLKNESILTDDDEIWTVTCPHDLNIDALQHLAIALNKNKCKIKVDDRTYECNIEDNESPLVVLTQIQNKFLLKHFTSKGIINFRRRIPKVHMPDDALMLNNQTNFIPLPDTKIRHPLFGSNYKKAIKISGAVKERLAIITDQRSKEAKREHNTNSNCKDNEIKLNTETKHEPQTLHETTTKKKNKKRKHSEHEEKRHKKQKYNNSAEAWDTEKAIADNLFNF